MKLLFSKLKRIAKTETAKDTGIVFSGQLISTLLSALFFFLIARLLGPEKLGIYSTVAAIVLISVDTVDLSLNSSIIRFINSQNAKAYLKFAFFLKVLLGISLSALLFFTSNLASLFLQQDLSFPLKVASLFVLALFLFRFPKAVFQARKKFIYDAFLDVGVSILRLTAVLFFIFTSKLSITDVFWAHILATFILFLFGIKKISFKFLQVKLDEKIKKSFLSFHSWLTFGFVLAAIHSRIDTLFIMKFSGPAMVGFYQAGYRFFLPVIQFSSILSTVFAPRFASFGEESQAKAYLKKTVLLTAAFALLLFLFIPFVPLAVNLFYGQAYKASVLPTQILSVGFMSFIFSIPFFSCLLYRKGQTKIFALLNLLQFFLIIFFDIIFIPRLAAVGAALASSLTLIIINCLAVFWIIKK